MRPLTYFAFTLLSVVIQFCVMDFIQERAEFHENPIAYNESINKQTMDKLKEKPNTLALYYRSSRNGYEKIKELSGTKYPNSSLHNVSISTSTELAFTIFDVLYDENVSTTDITFTTEFISSTELDNVTEITLFEQTSTTTRPAIGTKKATPGNVCYCDLLYKQCDINCCCDEECSQTDKELFEKCKNFQQKKYHPLACGASPTIAGFGNLLCIAKTNLPDQRVAVNQKINKAIHDVFLWHENHKQAESYNFNRNIYKFGEPVWILRNKLIYYLDLPVPVINNYCTVRRKMKFLSNEKINCRVKLNDLEMFRVLNTVEQSSVITATKESLNNTALNCSSLHCTNWTIIYCNRDICVPYNKSLHSPICTESECQNIALKIEYIFNIYESTIVNVTIKLYAQQIAAIQYMMQEVVVKFFIGNATTENIVALSGNPGYIIGLPLITSFTEANHTHNFFNCNSQDNYISYAENKGGFCVLTKLIKKEIQFGINKRSKCRVTLRPLSTTNGTEACISIQKDVNKMAGVNRGMFISPYGNPDNLKDDDWLPVTLESRYIYGEFKSKRSRLQCFNIHTRFAFVFMYADLSDVGTENKLLSVNMDGSATNVTFDCEEYTTVITVDINFINMKSASRHHLAGPPHLNLNLPRDFFFPFPSNLCSISKCNMYVVMYSFVAAVCFKIK